ncbi:hypothetical protein CAL15_19375 [Bordetella genomosp. 13]|uniref:Secretin/TonB short N-terminal domain-containing protein n=2 Tax=Bordetella genomosp. 13 TaxID=463040 RepID=A0A1W6ZGF5_9BORD|nr:hypothetical protein CAL15_19375 [Bordetella genomosp. 13]
MTGRSASVGLLALVALLACVPPWFANAHAQAAAAAASSMASDQTMLDFDIPAQGLGDALEAYSRQTGMAVLLDDRHAELRANGVRGRYAAGRALQLLLTGMDLRVRYPDSRSVVVHVPEPDPASAAPALRTPALVAAADIPGASGSGADTAAYIGLIQNTLSRALCASRTTRPGGYRLALQLRLDAQGAVQRMRLLDSTGDSARDSAVSNVVRRLRIGAPPPPAMPQPVSILVLPAGPHSEPACPAVAYSGNARP